MKGMSMKTVAFVPIKLNSQRLPHKNLLTISNHPLCWHICNTLNQVQGLDDVYVYCSDPRIKDFIPDNILFLQRPKYLDEDTVKGAEIYQEFINTIDADVYVLAHTTSPFIEVSSCQNALNKILDGSHDSAFSAERIQTFAWYHNHPINYDLCDIPRTQDLTPIWVETSGFYMFKKDVFIEHGRRIGFNPHIQEVSGLEALDIDEPKDFEMACQLVKAKGDLV